MTTLDDQTDRHNEDTATTATAPGANKGRWYAFLRRMDPWLSCALLAACIAACVVVRVSTTTFKYGTDTNDSASLLAQAHIFASGKLYAQCPLPKTEVFRFWHGAFTPQGRLFTQYPPVHPAVLAIGIALFGSYHVMLPILAFLNTLLIYLIGVRLTDKPTGLLAAGLAAASPYFLIISSTPLMHSSVLLFCSLFVFFGVKSVQDARALPAFFSGLALGLAVNARVLDPAAFSVPWLIVFASYPIIMWFYARKAKKGAYANKPFPWRQHLAFAAGGLITFGAFFIAYNWIVCGSPLMLPRFAVGYHAIESNLDTAGAVKTLNRHWGHGWNTNGAWKCTRWLARDLLPLYLGFKPTMYLVLLAACFRRWGGVLLASIVLVIAAYLPRNFVGDYWSCMELGPRYYFPVLFPCLLLIASALRSPCRWPRGKWRRIGQGAIWLTFAAWLCFTFIGHQTSLPHRVAHYRKKHRRFTPQREKVLQAIQAAGAHTNSIIFVNSLMLHNTHSHLFNDGRFENDVLYAIDRGVVGRVQLMALYPKRVAWRMKGNRLQRTPTTAPGLMTCWSLAAPLTEAVDWEAIPPPSATNTHVGSRRWTRIDPAMGGFVMMVGRVPHAYALAHTYVHSPEPREATLRYSADDAISIRVNGTIVGGHGRAGLVIPDEFQCPATLKKGWNSVMLRVSQHKNDWGFFFRITDTNGVLFPDLSYALDVKCDE